MEIRRMVIEDYDKLYKLWMETPGMGLNSRDDSREGIEKYLLRNPNTCFVAEEDGKIIGGILCGHDGRRGYISHTVVAAAVQRRGIGRKLVECALQAFKEEGIAKVALVAFERNQSGNAFWEHMGFTSRNDLVYRNKGLLEMQRIDT